MKPKINIFSFLQPDEAGMMHEKEAITLTGVMKDAILQLCRSNLGYAGQLEVDGIICISGQQQGQQIVVKVHEKLFQDTPQSEGPSLNNGQDDGLDPYSMFHHYKRDLKYLDSNNPHEQNESDEEKASEISKDADRYAEDLSVGKHENRQNELDDEDEDLPEEESENNDSGINLSYYDQHNSESKLRHLLLANQAAKPYSLMPFYQRRAAGFPMPSMPVAPECKACGYTFAHTEMLREHNEAVHGVFTCNVCYRTFTSRSNLDRHARLHTGNSTVETA